MALHRDGSCGNCDGEGYVRVYGVAKDCPCCNGTGKGKVLVVEDCMACDGRGEEHDETCVTCGGRGYTHVDGSYVDEEDLDQCDYQTMRNI